jgi:hypothetical protein
VDSGNASGPNLLMPNIHTYELFLDIWDKVLLKLYSFWTIMFSLAAFLKTEDE